MNFFLAIPIEARLAAVFLAGTCLGSMANWAIYSLAWNARPISPWSRPHPDAPPRCPCSRVPVFGWFGLRQESILHGAGFWIRPMLLEVFFGLGLAWLYWWETEAMGLLPAGVAHFLPPPFLTILHLRLHQQFVAHAILATLMLAASMIDTDEKIIPDEITIVGTLLGLLAAAACPWSLLPYVDLMNGPPTLAFMHAASPEAWPGWLDGRPCIGSLGIALGCWLAWCFALLPRVWRGRHGFRRAVQFFFARLAREPSTYRIFRMAVMGGIAIAVVWFRGGEGWRALLSSLVGMAAGGGLVWAVRIIGSAVLQREAMGFGDVTLMAMLGAFLGWQAAFIIFFLAPFAGLAVAVLRLVLFRDKEIPYGPFLCLAAMFLIVCWRFVWNYAAGAFSLGWFVPLAILCCLALMAGMLGLWRLILRAIT